MNQSSGKSAIWTGVIDALATILLFVASTFLQPPYSDLVKVTILAIQPVAISIVAYQLNEQTKAEIRKLTGEVRSLVNLQK